MTKEKRIQNAIYNKFGYSGYNVFTNVFFYDKKIESDVIVLNRETKEDVEIEIKTSLSDYRADFNKKQKHTRLKYKSGKRPQRFYYLCSKTFCYDITVPVYAGLMIYDENMNIYKHKTAPIIRESRLEAKEELSLFHKTYNKYWITRLS